MLQDGTDPQDVEVIVAGFAVYVNHTLDCPYYDCPGIVVIDSIMAKMSISI